MRAAPRAEFLAAAGADVLVAEPGPGGDEKRLPQPGRGEAEAGGEHPGHGHAHDHVGAVGVEFGRAAPAGGGDQAGHVVGGDREQHGGEQAGEPAGTGHVRLLRPGCFGSGAGLGSRAAGGGPVGQGQQDQQRAGVGVGAAAGEDAAEALGQPQERRPARGPGRSPPGLPGPLRAGSQTPNAVTVNAAASRLAASRPGPASRLARCDTGPGQPAGLPGGHLLDLVGQAARGAVARLEREERHAGPQHRPQDQGRFSPTARPAMRRAGRSWRAGHSSTASSA